MIQCSGDIKKGSGAAVAASFNNQNSAGGGNEPNLNDDQEEDILDGQNNLKRQLQFISLVSNPIVKDQEPINPSAPIEKQIFEI